MHNFASNIGEPINTFVLPFVFTDKVKGAVESIWKCHNPQEHRLFLIDNSGEDFEDKKWLEENSHFYIRCYRNLGPAVSFNLGVTLARTKYVTIFSDDARLVHPNWFEETVQKVDEKTVLSLNSIYYHKISADWIKDEYTEDDYILLSRQYGNPRESFGLATAIALKDTWIKSGLFNEKSYIYWIDGQFIESAGKRGIKFVMSGIVFHYGDSSHKGRLVEEEKYNDAGIIDREIAIL